LGKWSFPQFFAGNSTGVVDWLKLLGLAMSLCPNMVMCWTLEDQVFGCFGAVAVRIDD